MARPKLGFSFWHPRCVGNTWEQLQCVIEEANRRIYLETVGAQADLHRPTKAQLEKAMKGHVLAQASLVGTYARNR